MCFRIATALLQTALLVLCCGAWRALQPGAELAIISPPARTCWGLCERYAYPPPLNHSGFFEDYFDGKPVATFWRVMNRRLSTAA